MRRYSGNSHTAGIQGQGRDPFIRAHTQPLAFYPHTVLRLSTASGTLRLLEHGSSFDSHIAGQKAPSQWRWLRHWILHLALSRPGALRLHVDDPSMELHQPVSHSIEDDLVPPVRPRPRYDRGQPVRTELPPLLAQASHVHAQRRYWVLQADQAASRHELERAVVHGRPRLNRLGVGIRSVPGLSG